jgi:hypothetical protein
VCGREGVVVAMPFCRLYRCIEGGARQRPYSLIYRQGKINDYYLLKNAKDVDNTEVNEK